MKKLLLTALGHRGVKPIVYSALLSFLFVATGFAGVPEMKVIVSDANGNLAFKGTTNANSTFATGNLQPGNYVVQFNSNSKSVKGNQYLLVVSAGRKKVTANSVPGEMFNDAGVAMKVGVGKGLKITGKIASVRMVDGKRYVWMAAETGSNLGGRWVEESVADARHVVRARIGFLRRMQDTSGEGSMLNRFHGGPNTGTYNGTYDGD
ncbi:MAG TPA: T9SS type A sorting domain-containing protein [Chthoniobacterales bacterium]|nr:T9SS type A sorting domain-containing protein [Chthoniobacterales bacterium]